MARAISAELVKLRGLPAVAGAVLGILAASVVLAVAVAAAADPATGGADAVRVTLRTVPLLQVGPILLGTLAGATEYEDSQVLTTLTATPARWVLLAGKILACLALVTATSAAATGAGFATALLTARDDAPARLPGARPLAGVVLFLAGVVLYLALVGLLSLALALILRSLVAPLSAMLGLVLVASPALAGLTAQARWLPDRAGSLLYRPDIPLPQVCGGGLTLLAWVAVVGAIGAASLTARDA